jgi:hypothetical protein
MVVSSLSQKSKVESKQLAIEVSRKDARRESPQASIQQPETAPLSIQR